MKQILRLSLGPKGNVKARKRWRKERRVGERVRNEQGKGTPRGRVGGG